MGDMRNSHRNLVGKPEGKGLLARSRKKMGRQYKDDI
jgi:hypothetical protein